VVQKVQAKLTELSTEGEKAPKHSSAWTSLFYDILPEGEEVKDLYYRSECRPLERLHELWNVQMQRHPFDVMIGGRYYKGKRNFPKFREWLDLRDRARKDLYWLGHDCIGTTESGSGFVEHVHREMVACFVEKNFDGVYHKDWHLDEMRAHIDTLKRGNGATEKEMLQLCPTGAFKSTANKVDCVQWMLACPDIRVFIITGSGPLSRKFLKEVKGFFYKPEGTKVTYFQALFPEYIVTGEDGTSLAPLTTPARMHPQPGTPTLTVNSIDGAIAGWHCDVWKGDDVVNEQNSNTEETRASLKDKYDNISQNRPDKWAFRDHLGTRYAPDDWYGERIEEWRKYPDSNALKYLCRSAWTVKPDFTALPIKQLQAHMVDLYFPEQMPFSVLIKKCRQNEKQFRCQQLNEPAGSDLLVHFDAEDIQRHTIVLTAVPRPLTGVRRPIIRWDTAHGEKVQSDYSVGAVGWADPETRSLYILEVAYGKWRDSATAQEVVKLHWKWDALYTEIEKFHGWELFGMEIQRISMATRKSMVPLYWREIDMNAGSKRNWVKGLETLIKDDRLWFVDGDWMEITTQQFVRFTGFSPRRKDDIPDAISKLQRIIPRELPAGEAQRETEPERKRREAKELRDEFQRQHADAEYRTAFQSPPPERPMPAEAGPVRDRGPQWIFGDSGIHL
jgi:hypothetical protein